MVQTLDITRLFGGQALAFDCLIFYNGYGLKVKGLIDIGANSYGFINRGLARRTHELFPDVPREALSTPAEATGYKDNKSEAITHATRLHMRLDGREELNVPFLEVSLGHHDIILGRAWLAYNDVLPDCKRHRLRWPKNRP